MESKSIDDLKSNPQNPRTLSRDQAAALKASMNEFGDLSSIVFNTNTGQLVGGHQRIATMKSMNVASNVQITQVFNPATEDGTTAIGYVVFAGKQFPYRQVNWDLDREMAANIASNKIGGEFDNQLLAEALYNLKEQDEGLLQLTGFDEDEINKLLKSVSGDDVPGEDLEEKEPRLSFKITAEQKDFIERTIAHVKADHAISGKDEEMINGKVLIMFMESYLSIHPLQDDVFTPPEIPTL